MPRSSVRWRRIIQPRIYLDDERLVEESFWSDTSMPLANIVDITVEWIPRAPSRLVIMSGVGNVIAIPILDDSEEMRSDIGRYVVGTPLARWLSAGTREALLLEPAEPR